MKLDDLIKSEETSLTTSSKNDIDQEGYRRDIEPPRVFRRLFRLSHAAIAGWSSVA